MKNKNDYKLKMTIKEMMAIEKEEEFWKFMESTLTGEQYNVLYARFIENKTCETIAKKLKCSNQRALQIEVETLKKLRHPVRLRVLEKEFC